MIAGIQIVGLVFSFSMIYFASIHFRRKEINLGEMGIWFTVWFLTILAILFPDLIQTFSKTFLFIRLFDMMVSGAFVVVIVLAAKAYIKANRMEKKLNDLIDRSARNIKAR